MIRIFVGCAPNHEDIESQAVLEWSIRKHASQPVEIEWMKLSRDPASFWYSDGQGGGWNTTDWATPFSGFRWSIPARCNFEGRAIYMDSDVIVMGDVAELFTQRMTPGTVALAKGGGSWRYCVSLWNCAEAAKHIRSIEWLRSEPAANKTMISYFASRPHLTQAFAGDWNCLDGEGHPNLRDGQLKALHYTDMGTQPQLRHALPRLAREGRKHWFNGQVRAHPRPDVEALFDELLAEAKANGYGPERYAQDEIFGPIPKRSLTGYKGRAA
ncbi:MAG: glycosyl transferase [Armatimonadia bacterium]